MLEYDKWANERALNSLISFDDAPVKAVELFSHIIISQFIWLDRILGKQPIYKTTWDKYPLSECNELYKSANNGWINYVKNSSDSDMDKEIEYQNTKGETYRNRISDVIIHVINHSTYHRGQIASLVRNAGGTPAVSDFIVYKR
jgi:uncharacterized damage-inducible protein DinB